ncbi:MAG: C40 family peptidase [Nitrospirota bacterium]
MICNFQIIDKKGISKQQVFRATRKAHFAIFFFSALLLLGCAGGTTAAGGTSGHRPVSLLNDFSQDAETLNQEQSRVLSLAQSLLGTPYRYGGMDPNSGFDCSGYLSYVFKEAVGISLPRRAKDQGKAGEFVSSKLQPADILVFKISKSDEWHTGIYLKDGQFIHAPSRRGGAVNIQNITLPYWKERFVGARRVLRMA